MAFEKENRALELRAHADRHGSQVYKTISQLEQDLRTFVNTLIELRKLMPELKDPKVKAATESALRDDYSRLTRIRKTIRELSQ